MAVTQTDLDDLEEAINSGALIVRFADRQVQYRNLDEMRRIAAGMKAQLNGPTTKRVRVATRSGWR